MGTETVAKIEQETQFRTIYYYFTETGRGRLCGRGGSGLWLAVMVVMGMLIVLVVMMMVVVLWMVVKVQ